MKLPQEWELSPEQKAVCYAPAEGTMLVTGPPGCGKTVVALYRAMALLRQQAVVQAVVFNNVLRRYTSVGTVQDAVCTFHHWINAWWKTATNEPFPMRRVQARSRYGKSHPPEMDHLRAFELAKSRLREALRERGHWSHLILDEAQDFAREAHQFLHYVQNVVFGDVAADERPTLLVLADENQRLTQHNSTLEEIRNAHLLRDEDSYELRRNYRNTREIAVMASHFYVGLETGMPEPPAASGDRPKLILTSDRREAVARIARYAKINANHEIAVLVYFDNAREAFTRELTEALESSGVTVQTYTSKSGLGGAMADQLRFDAGGTVTVLCFASAKGLEFDAVFLPELQQLPVDADRRDEMRMNLYVMTSRARKHLWLMLTDPQRTARVWELLPMEGNVLEVEHEPNA